jgi:CRISPR type III-A-associated protein Csm2
MAENEQQQANPTAEKRPNNESRPGGGDRGPRREAGGGGGERGPRRDAPGGGPRGGDRPGGDRGGDRDRDRGDRGGDRGRERRFDGPPEIDLEKLIQDSLYLDNQAHAVVARMRDMDSGTKSQLRRFYNAVRRACSAAEADKQHQFVMLRARLAYTIARHQLRSLDILEKLLLQVTRKNDVKGYERFRDLFEAIVAYNE